MIDVLGAADEGATELVGAVEAPDAILDAVVGTAVVTATELPDETTVEVMTALVSVLPAALVEVVTAGR